MEQRHTPEDGPIHYQIQVRGPLDTHWSGWLGDLTITHDPAGNNTLLAGRLLDQAALFGVISRIRDLGLTLLSVQQVPAPRD
jgi:hypothetical protein